MRCKLVKGVLLTLLAATLLGCGAEKKMAALQQLLSMCLPMSWNMQIL